MTTHLDHRKKAKYLSQLSYLFVGEKLVWLKEKLSEQMKVRRQESIQKRYEMYSQEFGDREDKRASESEKEEEEEEMTEESSSEDENGDVEEGEDLEESYQLDKTEKVS